MFRKILSFLILASLLVPTVGCGQTQIKLTIADNGKSINVKVGEEIVVELAGNPSTGYTWDAKNTAPNILEQVGPTEFKSNNPGLVGAAGILYLTFKPIKAGETTLTLIYHRPWETNIEPQSSFIVTLTVK